MNTRNCIFVIAMFNFCLADSLQDRVFEIDTDKTSKSFYDTLAPIIKNDKSKEWRIACALLIPKINARKLSLKEVEDIEKSLTSQYLKIEKKIDPTIFDKKRLRAIIEILKNIYSHYPLKSLFDFYVWEDKVTRDYIYLLEANCYDIHYLSILRTIENPEFLVELLDDIFSNVDVLIKSKGYKISYFLIYKNHKLLGVDGVMNDQLLIRLKANRNKLITGQDKVQINELDHFIELLELSAQHP